MYAGYLRKIDKPSKIAKIIAITCKQQGIELVYFTPKDVNLKTHMVNGKIFLNNQWVKIEVPIPKCIDVNPYLYFSNKKVMGYLNRNSILSPNQFGIISKDKLQRKLLESGKVNYLAIPTSKISNFNDLLDYVIRFKKVVVKPKNGLQGKNVYVLKVKDNDFLLGLQKSEEKVTQEQLQIFYEESLHNKGYLIQKYISSTNIHGDPYDCRIHLEKDGQGEWKVLRNYIRIGIGQKVVSNINQGGGIGDLKPFLQSNFPSDWKKVRSRIRKIGKVLPYEIEKVLDNKFSTMGIDVGIDKGGNPYVFEINSYPIVSPVLADVAMTRAEYYKYVLEKANCK